jgi:hypothetical protein
MKFGHGLLTLRPRALHSVASGSATTVSLACRLLVLSTLLAGLLACAPDLARAWVANGSAATTAANNQAVPSIVADGFGGAIVTWEDETADCDVYAQRFDASGQPLWGANGVLVNNHSGSQCAPRLVADGVGGAIIVWSDSRGGVGTNDIYAARVTAVGVVSAGMWGGGNGRVICNAPNGQYSPRVASDGQGGAIIVWQDERTSPGSNSDIYAQRVDSTGALRWNGGGNTGLAVCTASGFQQLPNVVADGAGGAIFAWIDTRNNGLGDVYAMRLNSAGNSVGWTANGVALCTEANDQQNVYIAPDAGGGAIVAWQDNRSGNQDIYAQRVNASGSIPGGWSANGVALCTFSGNQTLASEAPGYIVSDGAGGAIVTWQDLRSGNVDVYAQRVNAAGTIAGWPSNGVALCTALGDQYATSIVADGTGGAFVVWKDSRPGASTTDIYENHVLGNGTIPSSWPVNGVAVCTASGGQYDPAVAAGANGASIVAWSDARNGASNLDVFAQRVTSGGAAGVNWDYAITTSSGLNGTIAPLGTTGVVAGSSQTVNVIPDAGSHTLNVVVDGSSVGVITSTTFSNVAADHTVSATFAVDSGPPTAGWVTNGAPISTAPLSQEEPTICSDAAGGAIVAWTDFRNGGDIYAQRVNASGVAQWTGHGVPVCTASGLQEVRSSSSLQIESVPALVSDAVGGAIIVWQDHRGSDWDIYAQRVTPFGTIASGWPNNGVPVCTATGDQRDPTLVSDGAGGAIIVWRDHRSGTNDDVYAMRLTSGGSFVPGWSANGTAICTNTSNQQNPVLVADGSGGAVIAWDDARTSTVEVFAQRVTASGSIAAGWIADGVDIEGNAAQSQLNPAIASDGAGGAFVAWRDSRGAGGTFDIYAQHVDGSGAIVPGWAAKGNAIATATGDQQLPSIIADDSGGAIIAWYDSKNCGFTCSDVVAQRVNGAGALQWGAGSIVCNAVGEQQWPSLAPDGAGGAVITWMDYRNGTPTDETSNNADLMVQHLDSSGVPLWTANGLVLCTAPNDQLWPNLVSNASGSWIATWFDQRKGNNRDSSDVYVQRVSAAPRVGYDYSITILQSLGGTITPSGIVGVMAGDSRTFTVAADSGYQTIDVMVDNLSRGAASTYTFSSIAMSHFMSATFAALPVISELQPNHGGNDGSVSVIVSGDHFRSGATARLARSGQSDVLGAGTDVAADGLSLATTFDLNGKLAGSWNVVVTNVDATADTVPSGFTVEAIEAPALRVDLVGRDSIRTYYPNGYDLVINNLGNVDALDVPVWLSGIPISATVSLGFPLGFPHQDAGEPDWTQDSLSFTSNAGRYLVLVIPRVPPGATSRRVNLTIPNGVTSFTLHAAVAPPWADGAVFRGCLASGGVTNHPSCMGAQLTMIDTALANSSVEAMSGIGVWAKIAWQCEGAATLSAALGQAHQVLEYLRPPIEQGSAPIGCGDVLLPRWRDELTVVTGSSIDPNDKLGARKTLSIQQNIPYTVVFENLSTAGYAAHKVRVVDNLDVGKLDPSTIRLGAITIGNVLLIPTDPRATNYSPADVPLRPTMSVRVRATIDRGFGLMTWDFTSVLPNGSEAPADSGFLLANQYPPLGQGSVQFTVEPQSLLASGTSIANNAAITFDGTTGSTPDWLSTVDNTPPASRVIPRGASNTDSATFTVRWEALNSPADLKDFSIYVSENGAPYRPWRVNTVATADTFAGHAGIGNRYTFYSLARDTCGNVEAAPASSEDSVVVLAAPSDPRAPRLELEGANPNPALDVVRAWFTLPDRSPAALEIIDVAGRRVLRREVGVLGLGRHSLILGNSHQLRPGLYFMRLIRSRNVLSRRFVVVR